MEVRSLQRLQSPTVTGVPSALTQTGLRAKLFARGQVIKIPNSKRYPDARKLKFIGFRAQASGTTKFGSEAGKAIPKNADSKDDNLVFVAGATGRVGSRTVRELLKLGFKVRAGVRSAQRAESLLQSVQQMKLGVEIASEETKPIEKLEIVECDLEKQDQIGPALGNASVVICCIGASEKEVFDITGPYRIDYQATKNLIDAGKEDLEFGICALTFSALHQKGHALLNELPEGMKFPQFELSKFVIFRPNMLELEYFLFKCAATAAKANQFILLTSLGTNKFGFPAAILNLFWGVLIWKRKAEEALLASGLPYTIVRPGGMERPTDAYKETHNITLSEEDTLFGGQVSNLQVAELMAFMAKNRSLSYCKVVEVIAETTTPLTPMGDLLAKIPSQRLEVKPLKESDAAGGPQSAASKGVVSEPPKAPAEKETAKAKAMATGPLSPYIVYDDLKPPTSPSPNAPTGSLPPPSSSNGGSQMATVLVNSITQALPSDKSQDEHHDTEPKPRPLSPFTMNHKSIGAPIFPPYRYEDLKPPTSPMPSPRKL